jgi:hypothetical protein
MAQLRTTTKGQLAKYTAGVISVVTNAMKNKTALKVGTKNLVPIQNAKNKKTLEQYSKISIQASKEKEALALLLDAVSGEIFPIGNIEKPKESGNKGDVAEGVIGAAMTARFINKNKDITKEDIKKVLSSLGTQITKIKSIDFTSANKKATVIDDVNFYLSLAESNMKFLLDKKGWVALDDLFDSGVKYANGKTVVAWSKLLYENNQKNKIEVISDGLGNQTGTKVDVKVKIDGKETNINLSLKAGDVKQFGQVSGSTFDKQINLWKRIIGFDVSNLESKYDKLVSQKKINDAVYLTYNAAQAYINSSLKQPKTKTTLLKKIGEGIEYFATLNEKNVALVQMTGREAKIYNFSNVYESIKNLNLRVRIKDSAGKPKLILENENGQILLEIRVKAEGRPDGSLYLRNYIEKGPLLGDLIATYA